VEIHEGHEGARIAETSVHEPFPFQFAMTPKVNEQTDAKLGSFEVIEKLGFFSSG
jgi:hypothetical protein